ncbi:hypothetical protein Aduo_000954 [Ancylostoma duodenale]
MYVENQSIVVVGQATTNQCEGSRYGKTKSRAGRSSHGLKTSAPEKTEEDRMTPAPIPTDKRLHAKRAVRRVAKEVRTSMKLPSRNNGGGEFWRILEK